MDDTTELTSEAGLAELEQLMKQLDEKKRERAVDRAELEEMKLLVSEVQAKVAKTRLEVEDLSKQRKTKLTMLNDESEKVALANNNTILLAKRLQTINMLVASKKRGMQAFGADQLKELQRKAAENQERMDDAPWIPEHNKLVNGLRAATSEVDALKAQVGEAESQVTHYERQLHGHSKLQFKDFLFKACEMAVKDKRNHSTLCNETRLNAEEDYGLSRGSQPSRDVAVGDQDNSMETDDVDQHLTHSTGNVLALQDTDDTLADLDITERDVEYERNDAAGAYRPQHEMDTSLISEVDEGETGAVGNEADGGSQKFVTPVTPSATSGVDLRQDVSEESTPAKQAPVQRKSRNSAADERPSSSQRNNQLSPLIRTPLANRAGTEQEGRWLPSQQHSGTPSRPARNSDYDASPRALARAVPSGSTDSEPRTPVTPQRPSLSAKPSSKPVEQRPDGSSQTVFRAPPPPKTPHQPKTKQQQQAVVEKGRSVIAHKDTPRPPEKNNVHAASTSTDSNVASALVDGAGGEDAANRDMFSFGFGDAGNDNDISFFKNASAADELVNMSLQSAGSADNFLNLLGDGGSSNDGDGGFGGFDFGFGGSGDANCSGFDFGSGGDDAAGTSFLNMSQQFNEGTANDDGAFNFGFD
ncbi:hypothetical protein AAVH_12369 [Aphelenchoides avenae]|nr:hypothetical protein AAVH_12369 [Aphelenchus avenae]